MINSSLLSAAMQRACNAAQKCIGATAPNPPVGAFALDENGGILALASHRQAGEDHAEAALLKVCRENNLLAQVHAIGVTLEPCNHFGRTPPCTESIIASGIRHVVIGAYDPNPNVRGGGAARLRQAGIEVIEGVESEACLRLIHPFAYHALTGKPFITIKRAFDENGSMMPPKGEKTFTSNESLALAHRLRKKADAILTGSGTILADRPSFTVRHVSDHNSKRRILAIMDRGKRVECDYIESATERGMDVVIHDDVSACLSDLERRGVRDVLVEAGPTLSQALLDAHEWSMLIDIFKGTPDTVKLTFNPQRGLSFNPANVRLELLLPP